MKPTPRLALSLVAALALPLLADAQTSTPPAGSPSTPQTPVGPVTPEQQARFTSFATASPAVQSTVSQAQAAAGVVRNDVGVAATTVAVSSAVARATTAITQDGRVARAGILAERQASLTRLRLAQTEQDRRRAIDDLRLQSGQRMEEQREIARLVRDRLRELRDTTTVTKP